jgi:rhodanese-related sulfurtransferase
VDPAVRVAWGREGVRQATARAAPTGGRRRYSWKARTRSELVAQRNNIDAKSLRGMLERGKRVTMVDVRKREAFAEGSIPGSVNFDAYEALHAGDERAMEGLELPEGAQVVTVCNRGHSSAVAAEQLRREGYEAYYLEGGLEAWKGL